MNSTYASRIVLFLILLLSALLRFYGFDDFSLSNDELSALYRTNNDTFQELIQKGVLATDPHPAGVQIFLYYWVKIFGTDVFWFRLPFVLLSVFTVYLAYHIGRIWFGKLNGLLSASFFSVSHFAIMYGQIARPYAVGLFLALLLVIFWTDLIKKSFPDRKSLLFYALIAAACCYTHYFCGLFAFVLAITGFFLIKKDKLSWYFGINLLVAVLYLPHFSITMHQLDTGGLSGWLPKPEPDFFLNHLIYLFNESAWFLTYCLFLAIVLPMFLGGNLKRFKFRIVSISWFIFPILLGYAYSLFFETVLMDRVLLFTFPFLIFFLFSFVNGRVNKPFVLFTPLLILIPGAITLVYGMRFYETAHFEDFEVVTEKLVEWEREYGKDQITHTVNVNSLNYLDYYFERMGAHPLIEIDQIINGNQLVEFKKILDSAKTPYFVNGWACIFQPLEIEELILRKYPVVIEKREVFNTMVALYGESQEELSPANFLELQTFESGSHHWELDSALFDTSRYYSPPFSYRITKKDEYGPTFRYRVKEDELLSGKILNVSSRIFSDDGAEGLWVFHAKRADENLDWRSSIIAPFIVSKSDWNEFFMTVKLPDGLTSGDEIAIYFWNKDRNNLMIDDVKIYSNH